MCKMLQMRDGLVYTLVFIKKEGQILLGLKKRGLGKNKWNGFGGKLEKDETIHEGAIRETKEECNLDIKDPKHIGILTYEEQQCQNVDIVHVFIVEKFSNTVQESEEMMPKWFEIDKIPVEKMWPDFSVWNTYLLNNKYFHAHTLYDNNETYKSCIVKEFNNIEKVEQNTQKLIDKINKN